MRFDALARLDAPDGTARIYEITAGGRRGTLVARRAPAGRWEHRVAGLAWRPSSPALQRLFEAAPPLPR